MGVIKGMFVVSEEKQILVGFPGKQEARSPRMKAVSKWMKRL